MNKCECGAEKTFRAAYRMAGHSSWCPWSVDYVEPVKPKKTLDYSFDTADSIKKLVKAIEAGAYDVPIVGLAAMQFRFVSLLLAKPYKPVVLDNLSEVK